MAQQGSMDRRTVLTKTAKGLMEVTGKTSLLPRDLRNVLSQVDGKATVGDLHVKLERLSESRLHEALARLVREGFVREFVSAPASVSPPSQVPIVQEDVDLDFSTLISRPPTKAEVSAQHNAEAEAVGREVARAQAESRARAEAAAKDKADGEARAAAEAKARAEAEAKARAEAAERARRESEEKARREADARAKAAAEAKAKAEAEAKAKAEAEAKAKAEAEAKARAKAEAEARAKAEAKAKAEAEARAKAEAEARAKAEAEAKAKADAEAKAKAEAEARARAEAEARARAEAEAKARAEAEARARREAEQREKREAEERARLEAEARARAETEARAKAEAEARAKRELEELAKREAEEHARREAAAKERAEAEARAGAEAEAKAKREAEERARREAEEKARAEAEARERAEAEAKARADAAEAARRAETDRQHRESEDRIRRELEERMLAEETRRRAEQEAVAAAEAEARAQREAEERVQREAEEARARAEAEERARVDAEERARREAEEVAQRKAEEERLRKEAEKRARDEERARAKAEAEAAARARKEERAREKAESEARAKEKARQDEKESAEIAARVQKIRSGKKANVGRMVAIAAVAAVVGGLAYLQFMPLDKAEYEALAQQRYGQKVTIGLAGFSMFPSPAVRFENVVVGDVKIGRIAAVPEVSSLFGGPTRVFRSVHLEHVTMPAAAVGAVLFGNAKPGDLTIEHYSAADVRIVAPGLSLPPLSATAKAGANGVIAQLQAVGAEKAWQLDAVPGNGSASFELTAKTLDGVLPVPLRITDVSAKGRATSAGMTLTSFDGRTLDGVLSGKGDLRWGDAWSFNGEVSARQFDAARVVPKLIQGGRMEVSGALSASAPDAERLFAAPRFDGTFLVGKGTLNGVDLARMMGAGASTAGNTVFNEIGARMTYDQSRIAIRDLRLNAGLLGASGAVDVDPNGVMNGTLRAEMRTPSGNTQRANISLSGNLGQGSLQAKR